MRSEDFLPGMISLMCTVIQSKHLPIPEGVHAALLLADLTNKLPTEDDRNDFYRTGLQNKLACFMALFVTCKYPSKSFCQIYKLCRLLQEYNSVNDGQEPKEFNNLAASLLTDSEGGEWHDDSEEEDDDDDETLGSGMTLT